MAGGQLTAQRYDHAAGGRSRNRFQARRGGAAVYDEATHTVVGRSPLGQVGAWHLHLASTSAEHLAVGGAIGGGVAGEEQI